MTPMQIKTVQDSFALVAPDREVVAALFYHRLFELNPTVKPLFTGDMGEQGRKLLSMLGLVIRSLDHVGGLVPVLQAMGERHRSYGVEEAHYATVGEALLWALQEGLGEHFTPHVRSSWTAAYMLVAGAMIEGARRSFLAA